MNLRLGPTSLVDLIVGRSRHETAINSNAGAMQLDRCTRHLVARVPVKLELDSHHVARLLDVRDACLLFSQSLFWLPGEVPANAIDKSWAHVTTHLFQLDHQYSTVSGQVFGEGLVFVSDLARCGNHQHSLLEVHHKRHVVVITPGRTLVTADLGVARKSIASRVTLMS